MKNNLLSHEYKKNFRQEQISYTPQHKDYFPDKSVPSVNLANENESEYHEEDEAPGGAEEYDGEYDDNGMQDRRKKK